MSVNSPDLITVTDKPLKHMTSVLYLLHDVPDSVIAVESILFPKVLTKNICEKVRLFDRVMVVMVK